MQINRVKQALKAGRLQLGAGWSQFRSPEVARIFAAAGFDFAFIDAEHGSFDVATLQDICRTARLADIAPIVRVVDLQYGLVARALDCGAQGVILPRVESPELLAEAVQWTRFPPLGVRGYGLGASQLDYEPASFDQVIDHVNQNVLVVVQIESVKACERCDELLSVPGIDAVLIGPADLSISLGIPGKFEDPLLIRTVQAIRESCLRHAVAPGIHLRSAKLAAFWKQQGMLFLSCGNEASFLYEHAAQVAGQLRA
jgi:2-keto-3-deoxy-L-rhamnonate aldolase RhmA